MDHKEIQPVCPKRENIQYLTQGYIYRIIGSVQFSSVTQSCPTLCYPMNRSMSGLPVHHQLPEFTQTHVHRAGDAIQPSHPLLSPLLLPPVPAGIRVFSNESTLRMRWPKYWSFSLNISPTKKFHSVQFSRSVMSNSLLPHESQHARPPCPSPTPGVHSDSRPSSQ